LLAACSDAATAKDPVPGFDSGTTPNGEIMPGTARDASPGAVLPSSKDAGSTVGGPGGARDAAPDGALPAAMNDASDTRPPAGSTPLFVAVGYGAMRARSLDGASWVDYQDVQAGGGDDPNLIRGIGFADGRFVGVGNSIWYTDDGVAWSKASVVASNGGTMQPGFLSDVVHANGRWVAAGGNGLRAYSDDGQTFHLVDSYYAGHYRGIAAGNGMFVAVGHTYGAMPTLGLRAVSSDGEAWTIEPAAGTGLARVAFGNGRFVAVGNMGRCEGSADGKKWAPIDLTTTNNLGEVRFVDGKFVVRGDGAMAAWTSSDGLNFTPLPGAPPSLLTGAEVGGSTVFVGADWDKPTVGKSVSGPWTPGAKFPNGVGDIADGWVR
jgi:hypothetical protein